MTLHYELAQATHIGARRINQDRIAHCATEQSVLLIVADGMGGHPRGELAAQATVDVVAALFRRHSAPMLDNPPRFLLNALGVAHAAIARQVASQRLDDSPRTTVVVCVIQRGILHWTHLGDSRLYVLRNGDVLARSKDHSRVQQLMDEGMLDDEAAASHPERHYVLRCLGGPNAPRLEPARSVPLEPDDIVLLCSDGFWAPLTQRQIVTGFGAAPLAATLDELGELARKRAGPRCDNVSAIALRWNEQVPAAAEAVPAARLDQPTDVRDFTATEPDFQHMTDDEVERAVDELREALRKNANKP